MLIPPNINAVYSILRLWTASQVIKMDDSVSERALKRLPQRSLNFIYGSISSYCYIRNSSERLEQIRQANKLAYVLCDFESDCMRGKEDKKKRATGIEENRRQKSEEKQVRENDYRLRDLESCEALVCYVFTFGMDHINNIKFKDLWVLLCYHIW